MTEREPKGCEGSGKGQREKLDKNRKHRMGSKAERAKD